MEKNFKPKMIAFATQKGGVGKTMTCWHIAGVLAKQGKKVLVIDLDPQANLTSDFGIENDLHKETLTPYGCCQIFRTITQKNVVDPAEIDINTVIIKSPLDIMPTVDLIPSHIFLSDADSLLSQVAFKEEVLLRFLKHYKTLIDEYDYILMDTAPNMFPVNQNAFLVADSIVLLADPSIHSTDGMDIFIKNWSQISRVAGIDFNIKAIILNNVDMRSKQQERFYSYCDKREIFKALLVETFIPQSIELRNTEITSTPIIFNTDAKTETIREKYLKIVEELKEREVL